MRKTILFYLLCLSLHAQDYIVTSPADITTFVAIYGKKDVDRYGDSILVVHSQLNEFNHTTIPIMYFQNPPLLDQDWYPGKLVIIGGKAMNRLLSYNVVRKTVYFTKGSKKMQLK
jgi:hypothetical protein